MVTTVTPSVVLVQPLDRDGIETTRVPYILAYKEARCWYVAGAVIIVKKHK